MKNAQAKYIDLLFRAKATRKFIFDHPGKTYREISLAMSSAGVKQAPIMFLLMKNYVKRKYDKNPNGSLHCTYFGVPMEKFFEDDSLPVTPAEGRMDKKSAVVEVPIEEVKHEIESLAVAPEAMG